MQTLKYWQARYKNYSADECAFALRDIRNTNTDAADSAYRRKLELQRDALIERAALLAGQEYTRRHGKTCPHCKGAGRIPA